MPFDRRSLLSASAAAAGLAVVGCEDSATKAPAPPKPAPDTTPLKRSASQGTPLPAEVIAVLAAVSAQILPSDELGPGAEEAGVGTFLERTLAERRMRNLHGMLKRGAGFLNGAARQEFDKPQFVALESAQQEVILEKLATNKYRPNRLHGPTFMRIMVALTLEGFLGAPAHGGNQGGVGWTFAGYDPEGGRAAVFGPGGSAAAPAKGG